VKSVVICKIRELKERVNFAVISVVLIGWSTATMVPIQITISATVVERPTKWVKLIYIA